MDADNRPASECQGGMHLGLNVGGMNYWSSQVCNWCMSVCMYVCMHELLEQSGMHYVCVYVCMYACMYV